MSSLSLKDIRKSYALGGNAVQALRDVDVFVPVGCAQGICGICRTTVIDGIPDHHNSYLTSEERRANNTLLVCCDGCISETLTLDL